MSGQIDQLAGIGHAHLSQLRQKLVLDTLTTINDLVVFMNDEDRPPKLTKFEKLMEQLELDEDDSSARS